MASILMAGVLWGVLTATRATADELCGATNVLIVGAGFAGLAAAKELKVNGYTDFVVIEATNRTGGRVRSVQPPNFGGAWVEDGANWLEDDGSPVWDLAIKYGKNMTPSDVFAFEAFEYNENDTAAAIKIDAGRVNQRVNAFYRAKRRARRRNRPRRFPRLFSPPKDEGIVKLMNRAGWEASSNIDHMVQWIDIDSEFAVRDASINGYPSIYPTPYFVADQNGGFASIASSFATEEGIAPVFDTVVTKIDYDYRNASTPYKVKIDVRRTRNATCDYYLANHVILTVSEAVLEKNLIAFAPALVAPTSPFAVGQYIKLFYKFDFRVGPAYNQEFAMALLRGEGNPDKNDRCISWHNMEATVSNVQRGTSNSFIGSNIWICTLVTKAFEELLAQGDGRRLNATQVDALLNPLRRMFPETPITTADYSWYYPDWNLRDSFGRGAYSHWKIGVTMDDYYQFYGGGPTPKCQHNGCDASGAWRLHFSGTCACYNKYGVVQGAYYAGQRSARYVLNELGTKVDTRFDTCDGEGRKGYLGVWLNSLNALLGI